MAMPLRMGFTGASARLECLRISEKNLENPEALASCPPLLPRVAETDGISPGSRSGMTLDPERPSRLREAARRAGFVAILLSIAGAPVATGESVLFGGARIHTISGDVLDGASILVEDGRIKAVGKEIPAGTATLVDVAGKTIIPGLIDARSILFLPDTERRDRGAAADWTVLDAIDPFDDRFEAALAGGVTTVYVSPATSSTIGGRGAVLKLKEGEATADRLLKADAALELSLSPEGSRSSSLTRVNTYLSLRRAFLEAKEYRKTWDKYRDDLAEYEKKKKERDEARKKREEEQKKPDAKPDPKGDSKTGTKEETQGAKEGTKESTETKDPAKDSRKEEKTSETPGEIKDAAKPDEKRAEPKLERPKRPREEPAKEALLKALRGEMPVRVEADRADEILNALRLAEEFDLRLILDGAGEGARVAAELRQRSIPVIFGPILRGEFPSVRDLWYDPSTPAALVSMSVPVVLTSGATTPRAPRYVALQASLAAGLGMDRRAALRAVTLTAAEALSVADRVGSIEAGKDADLVVLDGDPLDTRSRVERVYIEGRQVYSRE